MTLLTIIGEDTSRIIPVLYAYKDQINHHVLLCDDDPSNMDRAKRLQKGMQKFSAQHSLGWYIRIISTNEDCAEDIKKKAKQQFEYEGDLWLNATDGYPAITILLSDIVRKEGGKVLSYDHFDNDLHIIEPDGSMKTQQLPVRMDLDSYITLLNYRVVTRQTKKTLSKRADDIMKLYQNESLFKKVRSAIIEEHFGRESHLDLSLYSDILQPLQSLDIIDDNYKLIPSKQKELQGDILEEYIFWLCEALSPDDIAMGVKIDFDDANNEPEVQKRVHNEFDILMIHKNRIYTVECKFSTHLDGLDFVYKYDAILDFFGNTSKAIITNISSKPKENYINMKASSNFQHSTLRRARMSGVFIYHESQINVIKFQNLVRNFFHSGG